MFPQVDEEAEKLRCSQVYTLKIPASAWEAEAGGLQGGAQKENPSGNPHETEAKAFLLFTEEQGRKSALGSGKQVVCDYQVC